MHTTTENYLHFDCQFGAAGDMLLGALLNTGIDRELWLSELSKLGLPENTFQLSFEPVKRCGLTAEKLEIKINSAENQERGLAEILALLEKSQISDDARLLASRIFQRLARAEARVHGCQPDEVHFHEIGAIDSIVDIVGFAVAFDLAGIESVSCSALCLGTGMVETEHGLMPVPAPAVLEILKESNAITNSRQIPFECLTPTAAAILCEVVQSWGGSKGFTKIARLGYGAGSKNPANWPNLVRASIGVLSEDEAVSSSFAEEQISVIEANIDDQPAQELAYASEKLLAAGALDVFSAPVLMKKGRQGQLITVICRPEDQNKMQELIIRETSSLGARARKESRVYAQRRMQELVLSDGTIIRFKIASDLEGNIVNAQAEFDDLALYAKKMKIPIKEAQRRAQREFFLKEEQELLAKSAQSKLLEPPEFFRIET